MNFDTKLSLVAREIFNEMPFFTNRNFKPEMVEDVIHDMKVLLKKNHMSVAWIDGVWSALVKGQPVYINLDNEWNWNFMTMEGGTKLDLLKELNMISSNNIRIVT